LIAIVQNPASGDRRYRFVRYLEPGRKRRTQRPTLSRALWLIAAALALALLVQAILR
jgi:hypothetical protein